jgi:MOSC domain-containing protein YiiM
MTLIHKSDAPIVLAVSQSATHSMSKKPALSIRLLAGLGVEGDAHAGRTVKHRSRVARDPTQPNLRQVHLIHAELHDELRAVGFVLAPGQMGENVTTRGLDLLALPTGTRLRLGPDAIIEVTRPAQPLQPVERYSAGLMNATLDRDAADNLIRKAGVMGIVLVGGDVRPGDAIGVEVPSGALKALAPV